MLGVVEARGADDDVHAVLDAPARVVERDVGLGEVQRHLGARLDDRLEVVVTSIPATTSSPSAASIACTDVEPIRPLAPSTATRVMGSMLSTEPRAGPGVEEVHRLGVEDGQVARACPSPADGASRRARPPAWSRLSVRPYR